MIAHSTFKAGTVAIALVLAAAALSSCADARRALGYDKAPPDEFSVIARAPLSQPPDYNLRPPTPAPPVRRKARRPTRRAPPSRRARPPPPPRRTAHAANN